MVALFQKLSLLLLSTSIFVSCGAIQIKDPIKQHVRPGLPTGTSGMKYSMTINASEEIKIESVSLLRNNVPKEITNFTLVDLADGKLLKPEAPLKTGNYHISFNLGGPDFSKNESESIKISYSASGKMKTTVVIPKVKPDLLMK